MEEDVILEKLEEFISIPEEERVKYIKELLGKLADAFEEIKKAKGLVMKRKIAAEVFEEIKKNQEDVLIALLYTVKPEFRKDYVRLLKVLAGIGEF